MSMPSIVRNMNERRIVDTLLQKGPMTRADLSRELALTRATVSNLVSNLIDTGLLIDCLITDTGQGDVRTGRPGNLIDINGAYACFIGAEIGVGHIRLTALDLRAKPVWSKVSYFEISHLAPQQVIKQLTHDMNDILSQEKFGKIRGLGIAVAGLISADGRVIRAPYLNWHDVPLLHLANTTFPHIEIVIAENDANAFAIAELEYAKENTCTDAVHILLDIGVGGGIVSNGVLLRGKHGSGGEIGHMPLANKGHRLAGPLGGALESKIGATAVLNKYRAFGGHAETVEEFLCIFERGDALAQKTVRQWARELGRGLASITALLDPEEFVFGGPLSALIEPSINEIVASLKCCLLPSQNIPFLRKTSLGESAPSIGSGLLALTEFLSRRFDSVQK